MELQKFMDSKTKGVDRVSSHQLGSVLIRRVMLSPFNNILPTRGNIKEKNTKINNQFKYNPLPF